MDRYSCVYPWSWWSFRQVQLCLSLAMAEFWTGIFVFIPVHGGVFDWYSCVYLWPWRSFGQVKLCLSLAMAEFWTGKLCLSPVMVEFWTGIVVFISGHGGVLDSYSFIYPWSWWSLGRVIYVYQLS